MVIRLRLDSIESYRGKKAADGCWCEKLSSRDRHHDGSYRESGLFFTRVESRQILFCCRFECPENREWKVLCALYWECLQSIFSGFRLICTQKYWRVFWISSKKLLRSNIKENAFFHIVFLLYKKSFLVLGKLLFK